MLLHPKTGWYALAGLMILFLAMQLILIQADPSVDISTSRGPFTDEGLNTCQARNYINHGRWGVEECDNLVKSPVFNLYLAGVFKLFGTSRITARLAILLGAIVVFMVFSKVLNKPWLSLLLLLTGGLNYFVFQFFHFSMVEILAVQFILLSIAYAYHFLHSGRRQDLILHFLFLFVTVCLKIQFLYLMVFPAGVFFQFLNHGGKGRPVKQIGLSLLGLYILATAVYILGWYIWVADVFDKVLFNQVTHRYSGDWSWLKALTGNVQTFYLRPENLPLLLFFWLSLVWVMVKRKSIRPSHFLLLYLAGIWVLLEHHKLVIQWLPTRYALSLLMAMALWCSVFIYVAFKREDSLLRRWTALAAIILVGFHSFQVGHLVLSRTYDSKKIIDQWAVNDFRGRPVAGVWATGLVWNNTAYVVPVWNDFTLMHGFMEHYKPVLVVTENGEEDSGGAFRNNGFILEEHYPVITEEHYGNYHLYFYRQP